MSLRRHKKLKHPDLYLLEESRKSELELKKRYKCELCAKPIASYSSLQRHMKLVHNKIKPEDGGISLISQTIKTEMIEGSSYPTDQPSNLSINRTPSSLNFSPS